LLSCANTTCCIAVIKNNNPMDIAINEEIDTVQHILV
jgi:hypothetical protein